jgi:peptidoglycan/xylan/chitin deacetylase (PgdA/CDA1 family)
MKQLLKNLLFSILYIFNKDLNGKASILMYHSINKDNAFFIVTEKNFKKQLEYLKRKKLKIIKLSDLIKKIKNREDVSNHVCITFDDGYKDNYDTVFPIIKKYSFPITIFIVTDYIGKVLRTSQVAKEILSESNIREMSDSGLIEFMPHTQSHCLLNKISLARVRQEIDESKKKIEQITQKKATVFAYPKGRFTDDVVEYLRKGDWLGAVTIKEGLVNKNGDLFKLERNSIDSTTTFIQFKGKISQTIDKYNQIKKWLKF